MSNLITADFTESIALAIALAINVAAAQVNPPDPVLHEVRASAYLPHMGVIGLTLPDGTRMKLRLTLEAMPVYSPA